MKHIRFGVFTSDLFWYLDAYLQNWYCISSPYFLGVKARRRLMEKNAMPVFQDVFPSEFVQRINQRALEGREFDLDSATRSVNQNIARQRACGYRCQKQACQHLGTAHTSLDVQGDKYRIGWRLLRFGKNKNWSGYTKEAKERARRPFVVIREMPACFIVAPITSNPGKLFAIGKKCKCAKGQEALDYIHYDVETVSKIDFFASADARPVRRFIDPLTCHIGDYLKVKGAKRFKLVMEICSEP